MKKVLLSLAILTSSFANASLTQSDVERALPDMHGLWESSVNVKGVTVFPQKGVFDMEGIAYELHDLDAKRSGKYIMWNSEQRFKAPIVNKMRVASGLAPVSNDDNEFVRLCRFDMESDLFYEMSATQANLISEKIPSFSPVNNCLLGGDTKEYWLNRYAMFYDLHGNKRGHR